MEHPHIQTLRKIDEAQVEGDLDGFFGNFTDDVVIHVAGHSSLAGDYKGLDTMKELFGKFMQAAGDYSFENHAYLADDEHGVVIENSTYRKNGESVASPEIIVCHFADKKVSEMWFMSYENDRVDALIG